MLHITELLPAGEIAKPTELLTVLHDVHKADCNKFVLSRKKSLTEYFQALFAQKKSDGMLEKQEMDHLRSRTRKWVAKDLCHKICISKSLHKPYLAQRKEDR